MRRVLLALLLVGSVAHAKGDKKAKGDDSGDDDVTTSDDSDDSDDTSDDSAPKGKGKDKTKTDDSETKPSDEPVKQDLTGHDLGTKKKTNEFEKDRFFVDKVDTEKTEDATLVQGSLTSSSFFYHESGSNLAAPAMGVTVPSASPFDRYFTDLRLQTDFRHIGGGDWEGRVDARARFVDTPTQTTAPTAGSPWTTPQTTTAVQSGLTGQNEYELRELWLIRNGERTDVTIGRQFITDLAAVKIDGVRFDYASSNRLTLLGFGGLYPLRGSRSLTTDYTTPLASPGTTTDPAGPVVGATGGGAAYRTPDAYGAVGAVALVPFKAEQPRVFATSNGYYRFGSTLDVYHFAVIDLVGKQEQQGGPLTDLSAGINYKPDPRLRMTASYNRVDSETLNVQANAFLNQQDTNLNVVQNEATILRLSTTQLRGSVSAGLGPQQRIEITAAGSYRMRPEVILTSPAGMQLADLKAATSVEVYGSITDRHSIKDARLGTDFINTFTVGDVPYQRSKFFAVRLFAAHDIKNGQGEWEAEISYSKTQDASNECVMTMTMDPNACNFGVTNGSILSAGGTGYYRFNRDWFGIASVYVTQTALAEVMKPADPTVLGLSGYLRLAYRF